MDRVWHHHVRGAEVILMNEPDFFENDPLCIDQGDKTPLGPHAAAAGFNKNTNLSSSDSHQLTVYLTYSDIF